MNLFRSLTRTIVVGFLMFGVVLIALSILLSLELNTIHRQAMAEHRFVGLLNTVLEIRRFEKNYFLFQEKRDYENALGYMDQLEHTLRESREIFQYRDGGNRLHVELTDNLTRYRETFLGYPLLRDQNEKQAREHTLHQLSAGLIRLAETATTDNQSHIAATLENSQHAILFFDVLLLSLLVLKGLFLFRRTIRPLNRLQEELTRILEGRQPRIETNSDDPEFAAVTRLLNLTLKNLAQRQEERLRNAQPTMNEAVLLRLVKTLGQPLANISTACQIILDEDAGATPAFRREMLLQIQQQAEQGNRLLASIQNYDGHRDEHAQKVFLAPLLERVVEQVCREEPSCAKPGLAIPEDLVVVCDPFALERTLTDLAAHALQRASEQPLLFRGERRRGREMRRLLDQSTFRPLVWLDPACAEVLELTLTLPGDDTIPGLEHGMADASALCLPREDGRLGLCMLPGFVRQQRGALLVDRGEDGGLLLRLWLPTPGEGEEEPLSFSGAG